MQETQAGPLLIDRLETSGDNQRTLLPPSHRFHALWVILLIWLVPPYAWHNMWKHKKYHIWFPYLIFLDSIFVILPSISFLLFVYPRLMSSMGQSPVSIEVIYLLISFSLVQVGYGIFLHDQIKKAGELSQTLLWPTVGTYVADYTLTALITPIAFPILNNPIIEFLKRRIMI